MAHMVLLMTFRSKRDVVLRHVIQRNIGRGGGLLRVYVLYINVRIVAFDEVSASVSFMRLTNRADNREITSPISYRSYKPKTFDILDWNETMDKIIISVFVIHMTQIHFFKQTRIWRNKRTIFWIVLQCHRNLVAIGIFNITIPHCLHWQLVWTFYICCVFLRILNSHAHYTSVNICTWWFKNLT